MCNCGVEYKPKAVRAAEAIEAAPEKSNRAIAAEIGCDEKVVRKIRDKVSGADQSAPDRRVVGLDGKTYTVPTSAPEPEPEPEPEQAPWEESDEIPPATRSAAQVRALIDPVLKFAEKFSGEYLDWVEIPDADLALYDDVIEALAILRALSSQIRDNEDVATAIYERGNRRKAESEAKAEAERAAYRAAHPDHKGRVTYGKLASWRLKQQGSPE